MGCASFLCVLHSVIVVNFWKSYSEIFTKMVRKRNKNDNQITEIEIIACKIVINSVYWEEESK